MLAVPWAGQDVDEGSISGDMEPRRLGAGLLLGIVTIPGVFVWFTLRRGYSTRSAGRCFSQSGRRNRDLGARAHRPIAIRLRSIGLKRNTESSVTAVTRLLR
jgi:hypothetical protein